MWIMLNKSFLSFVAHRDLPDALMVRARAAGDIEAVFPTALVSHTPVLADYPYRATVARAEAGAVIGAALAGVNYTNFKNSVKDPNRHDVYLSVWATMQRLTHPARGGDPYPSRSSLWPSQTFDEFDAICEQCGEPLDGFGLCRDCDFCEEHKLPFVHDTDGSAWCMKCEPEAFCAECGKLLDDSGSCPDVNCASYR